MTNKVIKNRKLFYSWLVDNYGKETKQKFINNLRIQKGTLSLYSALESNPKAAINSAIVWFYTNEGKDFWYHISEALKQADIPFKRPTATLTKQKK